MKDLISIIVPVYNAEKTLEPCIRSLVSQTYEKIEIILVNDGSRDQSLQICQRFGNEDGRIKVIDKANGGVSSARNAGLDAARGEYVMFCDSDDWVDPEWCQALYEAYRPGMLAMSGCHVEGEQTALPREIKADSPCRIYEKKDFYALYLSCFNAPWNKIYLRKILEGQPLRFHTGIKNGEDLLFNVEYLARIGGGIQFLDSCTYHYRWPAGESLSSKVNPGDFDRYCLLLREMKRAVSPFMTMEELPSDFYDSYFWKFQDIIFGILNSNLPGPEKYAKLKEILSSDAYSMVVSCVDCFKGRLHRAICRSRSPLLYLAWKRLRG